MKGRHFSLILLPSLRCNADCDYCFENKVDVILSTERFAVLMDKITDYMVEKEIDNLTVYWQGGEVLTLPPDWYVRAHDIIKEISVKKDKRISNRIQSNMIGYGPSWNNVLEEMFDGRIGSSIDYPNVHRKTLGGSPEDFNALWLEKVTLARDFGLEVAAISIPNARTLEVGAERFYDHLVNELGLFSFQINTSFPGGEPNDAKRSLFLDQSELTAFLIDLADVWIADGYGEGITVGPFDALLDHFLKGNGGLPCIWHECCAREFVSIGPNGDVAQCDCWVASYPQYHFGNIFESESFADIMAGPVRRTIIERPSRLIAAADCIDCEFLSMCHGGCPIRAFSVHGSLDAKDPYCETYKALFAHMKETAFRLAREGLTNRPEPQ